MVERKLRRRILIVVSQLNKAISHEWIAEELGNRNYDVHFALLNAGESKMENYLVEHQFPFIRIKYSNKFDIPRAIFLLWKYMRRHEIEIVHTHLFIGGLSGIIASKFAGISKRIYTRHHSKFHHHYFPRMVKYDRLINYLASDLIAPSKLVMEILSDLEGVESKKIHLVYHGFKLEMFNQVSGTEVMDLKGKYHITGSPIVGVVARWLKLKGIQYTIEAFINLLVEYPNAQLILANAQGDFRDQILQQLNSLPESSYRIVIFEENFEALYKLFDVFVHVPINSQCEAFGQVYVEALAAGIPSVFTLSGIALEFIQHEINALKVSYEDHESIYLAIRRLLVDKELAKKLSMQGQTSVREHFQFKNMIDKLDALYQNN